ncbi:MAG: hypothetical protein M3Z10_04565 [Gemmatimonadota bacterium]|nr:hypothetical protein [Gemmatimonadota bacterium]
MRPPSRARRRLRATTYCALSFTLLSATGCATLRATFGGYATGPDGLSRPQLRLRETMATGDFVAALAWHEDDALLRTLNVGIASYYAAQYARSGAVLDTAALLADDRITASVSRNALSLLTNDMARPYQPRRTERLLIPYYGMLAYARLGAWEDAAVEARRLSGLLAQYAGDRDDAERSLHAVLFHLSGAVFERAGNRGEAEVSYRAARALSFALSDSLVPSDSGRGDLLVVVERGYVAHRTTEPVDIYLGDSDRDSLGHSSESRQRTVSRIARTAGNWGGGDIRQTTTGAARIDVFPTFSTSRRHHDEHDDEHYLSIAFPVLRRSARPWGGAVTVAVDDQPSMPGQLVAEVDDASASDERRERVAAATRAIARAAAKYVVARTVREKKGETAGTIAEIAGSLLERADIRSWHLLPRELTLTRLHLEPGARHVRLQIGRDGETRTVDLGTVTIIRGGVTIVPIRLWSDPPVPSSEPGAPIVAAHDAGCTSAGCP